MANYKSNLSGAAIWSAVAAVGMGASAYHGYKRNVAKDPLLWGLWWAFTGALVPIVTVPIAIAQGFAKPASAPALAPPPPPEAPPPPGVEGYGAYYMQ